MMARFGEYATSIDANISFNNHLINLDDDDKLLIYNKTASNI